MLTGPGLGDVRRDVERASAGWVCVGVALEALSALSYVVIWASAFAPSDTSPRSVCSYWDI